MRHAASVNMGSSRPSGAVQHLDTKPEKRRRGRPFADLRPGNVGCGATRRTGHSLRVQNRTDGELAVCGTKLPFPSTVRMAAFGWPDNGSDLPDRRHGDELAQYLMSSPGLKHRPFGKRAAASAVRPHTRTTRKPDTAQGKFVVSDKVRSRAGHPAGSGHLVRLGYR